MLFRLERNPAFSGTGCLGYDWIEVLAIEPRALGQPNRKGGWRYQEISNWYICRTGHGVQRFAADDIWWALEENGEYLVAGQAAPAPNKPAAKRPRRKNAD